MRRKVTDDMKFRIGLRTIKTALGAAIAILLANFLTLDNATAAGIITLLSVTNTRRSSLETGLYRIASLILGVSLAFVIFHLIGFNAVAFGFFLLVFIPLSVKGNMSEGIAPSSVLVTHFLVAEKMTVANVTNSFGLLFIGVGIAWLANLLFMPDSASKLKTQQELIDEKVRQVLTGLSFFLGNKNVKNSCDRYLNDLVQVINQSEQSAQKHRENQLINEDNYFSDYFAMRRLQVNILEKMNQLVQEVANMALTIDVTNIQELFLETATSLSEDNDTTLLQSHLDDIFTEYREAELPTSRLEFELRAHLFLLLNEFDRFLNIKLLFHQEQHGK